MDYTHSLLLFLYLSNLCDAVSEAMSDFREWEQRGVGVWRPDEVERFVEMGYEALSFSLYQSSLYVIFI